MMKVEETVSTQGIKFSHKKWKALLKKEKRKKKRQNEAIIREKEDEEEQKKKEQSPSFQYREREKKQLELMEEQREKAEKAYFDKLWMEKERIAQLEFERKKQWEEKEKIRKAEVEDYFIRGEHSLRTHPAKNFRKIKEEWEEREKKEKEEQEREEKKKKHQICGKYKRGSRWNDSLLQQATANENKEGEEPWHNPIASLIPGKEKETCPFFAKTGACRFGERCSRGHPQPDTSTTMLIKGMYNHFELEQGLLDENDTDLILEYEDSEIYNNFRDFYDDIVPEFKSMGHVIQVKVCCNYEPHLRGNVYVQYSSEEETHSAMVKMNGRFYGGKQISCEPVDIKSWKSAICGLFGRGRCPKGRNCNFLHVFKNPRNEFWEYDKPQRKNYETFNRHNQSQRSHRYSRSRSRSPYDKRSNRRHSYSRDKLDYRSRSKYRSRSHRYSRSRSRDRYSRSRSRSRKYSRSRSRSQTRRKSRDRNTVSHSNRHRNSRSRSNERYRYPRSRSKERSRSYSKSRSSSRSPSRQTNKKKKKKHKKQKKHTKSDKDNRISNGETNKTGGINLGDDEASVIEIGMQQTNRCIKEDND